MRKYLTMAAAAVPFLSAGVLQAAVYDFNVANGDLNTAGNYVTGNTTTPTAATTLATGDTLQITNGGTATVSGGTNTYGTIYVGQIKEGTSTGTVQQTAGSLTVTTFAVGRGTSDAGNTGSVATASGTYTMTGGSLTAKNFRIGAGNSGPTAQTPSNGNMTVSGVGTTLTTGNAATVDGIGASGVGTFTLDNSAVWNNSQSGLFVGGDNNTGGTTSAGTGTNAAGGTGTLTVQNNAALTVTGVNFFIGRNENANGTVNVASGGSITLVDNTAQNVTFRLADVNGTSTIAAGASNPVAVLNLGGASSVINVPRVTTGLGTATLNLNGGTFTTNKFTKGTGSTTINFNGVTMGANGPTADYYSGFANADLNIQAGGQTFNTNGAAVTITQGMTGVGGFTKTGAGALTFGGSNAYGGATTVSGGSLLLASVTGALPDASAVTLSSGTLGFGTGADYAEGSATAAGAGSLTVAGSSVLDFGGGNDLIHFAASNGQAWTGTLSVYNYTAGTDHLYFGSGSNGLTPAQLASIQFYSDNGTTLLGTGAYTSGSEVGYTSTPEPATLALLGVGGLAVLRRRARV